MPVYEYNALNAQGKNISGIIDAESAFAARRKLRGMRQYPVSLKEVREQTAKKETRARLRLPGFSRVRSAELSMLTRQLSTLVGAGFPLVSALDSLIPQTESGKLKRISARVKESVVEGSSFAAALSQFPNVFSPIYINMVQAGESSGTLEIVLSRLAEISERQTALNNRIKAALAYPILMTVIGVIVVVILMTFIVPKIAAIFLEQGRELPLLTRVMIMMSDFIRHYWWILLSTAVAAALAVDIFRKTEKGRALIDRVKLKTPLFGPLSRKLAVTRFSRTLGSLLENGVSMITALDIVKRIVGNIHLSNAVADAAENVGKGQGLAPSLSQAGVFPLLSIQMIQVGEQSGELEGMLNKIADVYENEVESAVMTLTAMLEPLMILLMAGVVGCIVLGVCLPIFEMNTLVR